MKLNCHLSVRLNFLSINRFERKKNLGLAISAFALLRSVVSKQPGDALLEASLTVAGDVCFMCYFPPLFTGLILLHNHWPFRFGLLNNIRILTTGATVFFHFSC